MENLTLCEVSAKLDRMDADLGNLMKGFDANKSEAEFKALMAKCEALVKEMDGLYKLERDLKHG